jgi:5'-nucleotidase
LYVQTSRYGKYLGFLNIDINENGQIDSYDGNPVLLSSTTEPGKFLRRKNGRKWLTIFPLDPTLQGLVDDWEREVLTKSEEVIGSTKVPIVTNRHICWYSECSGGNLMADAARWYLETKHQNSTNWENSVAAAV